MFEFVLKPLANALSKAPHALCILTYHRVLAEPDPLSPLEPYATQFIRQLDSLRRVFNIVRLDQAIAQLKEGKLPQRALAITFDDGYRDNLEVALPILQRAGVPATFFIATGFMQGGAMFNDIVVEAIRTTSHLTLTVPETGERLPLRTDAERRTAIAKVLPQVKKIPLPERTLIVSEFAGSLGAASIDELMMKPNEVRKLHRAGMEIGAHTVNHPILKSLTADEAREEIVASKRTLEELVGAPVVGFAYPNGRPGKDYEPQHAEMVRDAGFAYGVSTRWATALADHPQFEFPRVAPWGRNAFEFSLRTALSYRAH